MIYVLLGEGNDNQLQYSCLENSMIRLQSLESQGVGHSWAAKTVMYYSDHPDYLVSSLAESEKGWSTGDRFWLIAVRISSSAYEGESCSVMSDSLQPHGLYIVHGIKARILEWVAFPFSRGSSQPRDRTQVSHIAGRFFTSWATREAQWIKRRKASEKSVRRVISRERAPHTVASEHVLVWQQRVAVRP